MTPSLYSCETSGKLFNLSVPHFILLYVENHSVYLIDLWGFNKFVFIWHLKLWFSHAIYYVFFKDMEILQFYG